MFNLPLADALLADAQWMGVTTRIAEPLQETGAVDAILTRAFSALIDVREILYLIVLENIFTRLVT